VLPVRQSLRHLPVLCCTLRSPRQRQTASICLRSQRRSIRRLGFSPAATRSTSKFTCRPIFRFILHTLVCLSALILRAVEFFLCQIAILIAEHHKSFHKVQSFSYQHICCNIRQINRANFHSSSAVMTVL